MVYLVVHLTDCCLCGRSPCNCFAARNLSRDKKRSEHLYIARCLQDEYFFVLTTCPFSYFVSCLLSLRSFFSSISSVSLFFPMISLLFYYHDRVSITPTPPKYEKIQARRACVCVCARNFSKAPSPSPPLPIKNASINVMSGTGAGRA